MANPEYVLGHSAFELERLARQERLIGGMTREYFTAAGLAPGMRVLDIGSGTGLVAFHAADLVGPSGEVIGTDLSPTAIAAASAAAGERGLKNVSFRQGNPAEMTFRSALRCHCRKIRRDVSGRCRRVPARAHQAASLRRHHRFPGTGLEFLPLRSAVAGI